jgi:lipoprotein-releasing system permease protein
MQMAMSVPFELFIALRYLLAGRKQALISLISIISMLGVTVGVMALLIALALMTGLQGELRDRIVGSAAQVYVFKAGEGGIEDYEAEVAKLKTVPRVVGAAPMILGKALLKSGSGEAFITLKGIDPALEASVTDVGRAMESGSLTGLGVARARDGILIGKDLARQLGVQPGETLTIITAEGILTPFVGLVPRQRVVEVIGTFSLGLFELDSAYGLVSLGTARRLLNRDRVDFIQLRLDDMWAAPEVADAIPERLGSAYLTQDWADMNRSLFSALLLEKYAIAVTIGLIVMVAALNIVASLVLLVMEKHRDIAILKTMGCQARSVRRIFVLQGLVIGLVGTIAGTALGLTAVWVLDHYRLIRVPSDVYQIAYVPFRLEGLDLVAVVIAAILICLVATIYPSRQAARLDPAQALRYE